MKTGKEGLPTRTSCQWVLSGKTDEGDTANADERFCFHDAARDLFLLPSPVTPSWQVELDGQVYLPSETRVRFQELGARFPVAVSP